MSEYSINQNRIPIDEKICVNEITSPKQLLELKKTTPARIGIGHAGARYTTKSMLQFWADQAAAADAVYSEVSKQTINDLGIFEISTKCKSKYEMITRPDLGRVFDQHTLDYLKENCIYAPDVQIYFGDGLCAPAISANIPYLFPTIKAGLESEHISIGTPFFVRYCRVNTARYIGKLLNATVTCVLIGERPGLITSESMSAYIAYHARPEMSESDYKVVSNISRAGIPPVEAGAYIVDIIKEMLKNGKEMYNL